MDFVLCLHQRLFFLDLSVLDGIADDAFCFLLSGAKLGFRHLFAVLDSQRECDRCACCQCNQDADKISKNRVHGTVIPPSIVCEQNLLGAGHTARG